MTQSIDNSEWVMQGVVRDPITGALLRVNADGSLNVSGGGTGGSGAVGTGTTITGGASITLNSNGILFNGIDLAGTATSMTNASATLNSAGLALSIAAARAATDAIGLNTAFTNVTATANSSGLSINAAGYAGTTTAVTGNASVTLNSLGFQFNGSGLAGTGTTFGSTIGTVPAATLNSAGLSFLNPEPMISSYQNQYPLLISLNGGFINLSSRSLAAAFLIPQNGSFSFIRLPCNFTMNSTTVASAASLTSGGGFEYSTWNAVVYSMGTGASSQSLISVASGSAGWTISNSYSFNNANSAWSISQAVTGNAYGNQFTQSSQNSQTTASANFSSNWVTNLSSNRFLDIPFANSISAGAYWMLVGGSSSSTTSGQGAANLTLPGPAFQFPYIQSQANNWFNAMNDTAGSSGGGIGAGMYGTAGGTTSIFAMANISSTASNQVWPFQLLRSA